MTLRRITDRRCVTGSLGKWSFRLASGFGQRKLLQAITSYARRALCLVFFGALLSAWPAGASAQVLDFKFKAPVTDDDFSNLMQPFQLATRFTFLGSASALGTSGFDIGAGMSGITLKDEPKAVLAGAIEGGDNVSKTLLVPRLMVLKGLPFDLNLAANVIKPLGGDLWVLGAGLQWTLIDGPSPIPSLALRAAYTRWFGVDSIGSQTLLAQGVVSLGLPPGINVLVPYVGAGMSWTEARTQGDWSNPDSGESGSLDASLSSQAPHALLGVQLAMLPGLWLTVEGHIENKQTLYAAKVALGL